MDFFNKNTGFFHKICYTEDINSSVEEVRSPMEFSAAYIDLRVGEATDDKPLILDEVLFCPALVWMCQELSTYGVRRFFVVCDEKWKETCAHVLSHVKDVQICTEMPEQEAGALLIRDVLLPVRGNERVLGWLKVASRAELAAAVPYCRAELCRRHAERGVFIVDPSATYIDPRAVIGEGTQILPGTIIRGKSVVGNDCQIGPNAMVRDCTVGDGTTVNASQINESVIGAHCTVGPFAYVRPHCTVGDHCRIGDFVELKNSVLGEGTKVSHLTYVGDSDVGARVNFGCGTVTSNYDGKKKFRCTVGDDVFLGCNTNLIAPVTVEEGAYTAAGSTITEDVPAGALAVARARQENKPGWVKRFFGKK